MASLRIDPQGKAYAQMALEMIVSVPAHLLSAVDDMSKRQAESPNFE